MSRSETSEKFLIKSFYWIWHNILICLAILVSLFVFFVCVKFINTADLASFQMNAIRSRMRFALKEVAAKMAKMDVRTVIKEVENTDENSCMPSGKYFQVEIQVKQAAYDHKKSKVNNAWETVKIVGVDRNGRVMEVCAE